MKHLRFTLLAIFALTSAAALAQGYRLKGTEAAAYGAGEKHELKLMAGGSFLMNTYGVTSDGGGLSARLPFALGFGAHTTGSYRSETDLTGMWWNASWTTVNYTLTGFTSPNVQETKWAASVGASLFLWKDSDSEELRSLALLLGYGAQVRNAGVTLPNAAISGHTKHGPVLGMAWDIGFADEWAFDTRLLLMIPFYHNEYPTSGVGKYSLGLEYRAMFEYKVTEVFSVATGIDLRFDMACYKGTGDRGTVNASDNDLSVGIPLEVRFGF